MIIDQYQVQPIMEDCILETQCKILTLHLNMILSCNYKQHHLC